MRYINLLLTLTLCISSAGKKGKGNPYAITESRVPELIPVLGSRRARDASRKRSDWLRRSRTLDITNDVSCAVT